MDEDKTINLHGFGIKSIEWNTFINYNKSIRTIILSSNYLSYIPNKIFSNFNKTLINLNLQDNELNCLNNNNFLRYLKNLRLLDISKNKINKIISENFYGLKRLDTLILRENKINSLSNNLFIYCQKLRTLDLSDNNISYIDINTFYLLNNLKILLLNNNPLGEYILTNKLFKSLKHLEYIDLENSQIKNLLPFLFISNNNLKSIKLRRNFFTINQYNLYLNSNMILKQTFCGTKSLIEIDLVNTNLKTLDICTYHQIPTLRRLYLMNNPLDCTCDLFYLKYGDIYRLLINHLNNSDQINQNMDIYLNHWISRPELRRHLENAFIRGDIQRLPIELSLFARCQTPKQYNGYEIDNITGIYNQCIYRWIDIEQQCKNYCLFNHHIENYFITNNSILLQYKLFIILLNNFCLFLIRFLFFFVIR
ncbi:unnamed protein product [Rotaria sp. Silwood1]|nr:unnamed protein product [Rotaria sp. Silwood1]CAF1618838.1 unnamed protein product [Rotaria sp. Silwood1]